MRRATSPYGLNVPRGAAATADATASVSVAASEPLPEPDRARTTSTTEPDVRGVNAKVRAPVAESYALRNCHIERSNGQLSSAQIPFQIWSAAYSFSRDLSSGK